MKGKKIQNNKMNKILISIIVCLIMMAPKIALATTIELKKNSTMEEVLRALSDWYGNHPTATESELAKQIQDICGGDIEKIKKLQNSYTYDGVTVWNGSDSNSVQYKATDVAIKSKQDNTQIQQGNQDDKNKMLEELLDMSNIAYSNNASVEDLKKLDEKLKEYKDKYGMTDNFLRDVAKQVKEKLNAAGETGKTALDEIKEREEEREEEYKNSSQSSTGILGTSSASASHTPDEIIQEANEFLKQGTTSPIDGEIVKNASSTLYNLLLSIAFFLTVAVGVYLGVKFMVSTAEDKAKVKEALIPYIVACIVIFSSFIIWKAVLLLLGEIS